MGSNLSIERDGEAIVVRLRTEDNQNVTIRLTADQTNALLLGLAQARSKDGSEKHPSLLHRTPLVDVLGPHFQVGTDHEGRGVLALVIEPLAPIRLRFRDEAARLLANSLLEIVNTPLDVRLSKGSH